MLGDDGPPKHEDKLPSLSGVNAFGISENWFWRVGSIAHRSLIVVRIVLLYAMRHTTLEVKFSHFIKKGKEKRKEKDDGSV